MPDRQYEHLHTNAETLLDHGKTIEARKLYAEICQLNPNDADAWLMTGLIDNETGKPESAISALQTAVTHNPDLEEAHYYLAKIFADRDTDKALDACEKAVALDPEFTDAVMLMGILYNTKQRHLEAANCYRQILATNKNDIGALKNLSYSLSEMENHGKALDLLIQTVKIQPDNTGFWLDLAYTYKLLGKLDEAINTYQQAINLEPVNIQALLCLAELFLQKNLISKTVVLCQQVLALEPQNVTALSLSGTAQQLQGNLYEAIEYLAAAVRHDPENPENNYKLGCVYQTIGDLENSLKFFNQTLRLQPESIMAISGLIRVYEQQGDDSKVQSLLPTLLEGANNNPHVLPTLSSVAVKHGITDNCLDKLQQALNNQNTPIDILPRLHWAIATLYDHEGNFDNAFENFVSAKKLTNGTYNPHTHSHFINSIITSFNQSALTAAHTSTYNTDQPIFIVGMPRSGTSLVEQILSNHNSVFGAGERDTIMRISQDLSSLNNNRRKYPQYIQELSSSMLSEAAQSYFVDLQEAALKSDRITDKMPHNFLYLGLIQLLFPKARVIHVSRNPIDTCLSCYFQEFSQAHAYTNNLEHLASHYNDYLKLMHHWKSILTIPILDLTYESLIENFEIEAKRMIEFCQIDWDDECLNFHLSDRIVSTLSTQQVREPIHNRSVGKWKRYEKHLEPLIRYLEKNRLT